MSTTAVDSIDGTWNTCGTLSEFEMRGAPRGEIRVSGLNTPETDDWGCLKSANRLEDDRGRGRTSSAPTSWENSFSWAPDNEEEIVASSPLPSAMSADSGHHEFWCCAALRACKKLDFSFPADREPEKVPATSGARRVRTKALHSNTMETATYWETLHF